MGVTPDHETLDQPRRALPPPSGLPGVSFRSIHVASPRNRSRSGTVADDDGRIDAHPAIRRRRRGVLGRERRDHAAGRRGRGRWAPRRDLLLLPVRPDPRAGIVADHAILREGRHGPQARERPRDGSAPDVRRLAGDSARCRGRRDDENDEDDDEDGGGDRAVREELPTGSTARGVPAPGRGPRGAEGSAAGGAGIVGTEFRTGRRRGGHEFERPGLPGRDTVRHRRGAVVDERRSGGG